MASEADFYLLDDDRQFMDKYPEGLPLRDLLPFYESLARDEPITLDWVCPGRLDPNAQVESQQVPERVETKASNPSPTVAKLKEFDFDESPNQPTLSSLQAAQNVSLPMRQVVGTPRHPPRQPRVANMDKILNDFFRTRKEPALSQATSESVATQLPSISDGRHSADVHPNDNEIINATNIISTEPQNSLMSALERVSVSTHASPSVVSTNTSVSSPIAIGLHCDAVLSQTESLCQANYLTKSMDVPTTSESVDHTPPLDVTSNHPDRAFDGHGPTEAMQL